ncbi:MAG TPA: hypothetical protein VFH27_08635 [Longimicrobiaceae bacterium]|nr:hypothetical protein [Longimicrobiaceae bacterium]
MALLGAVAVTYGMATRPFVAWEAGAIAGLVVIASAGALFGAMAVNGAVPGWIMRAAASRAAHRAKNLMLFGVMVAGYVIVQPAWPQVSAGVLGGSLAAGILQWGLDGRLRQPLRLVLFVLLATGVAVALLGSARYTLGFLSVPIIVMAPLLASVGLFAAVHRWQHGSGD